MASSSAASPAVCNACGKEIQLLRRREAEDYGVDRAGDSDDRDSEQGVLDACARAALSQGERDIKPENVFICEDLGERLIKVLDFGIAKRREDAELSMTSTGVALGSPYYMSPEQVVSAKGVDPRSDLWSLGVVAY